MIVSPADGTTPLNGLRFHFLDWGTRGEPPMLLLHGGAQTAHSWDEVAPDLARDHHALALAATHPERIAGLVVVDVTPTISQTGGKAIAAQLQVRDFASFEDAVARAQAFNPLRSAENIRARLRHALRQGADGRWSYKFDPGIGGGGLETDFERLWEQVREIRCPTLLVRGAQSAVLAREAAARFVRELPGSTVVEVPGAGHSVMGDNPSGFIGAVRPFLARHGL